jgi:hypothetical protein
MLFHGMYLRISAAREFNMDTGLLFIDHERPGPEGEDIGSYIAACQELVDTRDCIKVRAGDSRDEGFFFYHATQFRDLFHQSFRGLFCSGGGEQGKGSLRKKGRTVHCIPRVNERRTNRKQGICGFQVALLDQDNVHVGKYFVDEPLAAGTGLSILEERQGGPFVKCPDAALGAREKEGRKSGQDLLCRLHAVRPAYRTFHALPMHSHDTKVFKLYRRKKANGNRKIQGKMPAQWARRDSNP